MNPLFYVFISLLLVAGSQFLFKAGVLNLNAGQKEDQPFWLKWIMVFFKKNIILGLALNALAAVFWLLALSDLELSYVFPFLALNYVIVPVGASFLYHEKLSRTRITGIIIICIGVLCIAFS